MNRGLRALVVAATLMWGLPAPLLAHARLKSSNPAAGAHLAQVPALLRLDFSETAELAFTSVRLRSANGREISLGPLALASDSRRAVIAPVTGVLEPGTYIVIWQMAGDDGHPVRGQFDFVVAPGAMGANAAPGEMAGMHHDPVSMPESDDFGVESPLYVLIRWAEFAALLVVVGAVVFRHFVVGQLRHSTLTNGESHNAFASNAEHETARIGLAATGVLAATLLLRLIAQSYAMHGAHDVFNVGLAGEMIRKTMWGWGWLLQLVGVILALVGFYRSQWALSAIGAISAAFSPALSGHAASVPTQRPLAILADGIHVLSASSWLGTLTIVLIVGLTVAKRQPSGARGTLVRSLINAFSPVALVSAGMAALTGVFAAWLHVGTIPNLLGTRYGVTLMVKLAILGIVALTGLYNWRVVQPRLGTDDATARLRRSARVEVVVAVLVLLVTAILVALPTSMDATM